MRSAADMNIVTVVAVTSLITGLAALVLYKIIYNKRRIRLANMIRITEKMTRLEFDEKVYDHTNDGLGKLAGSIDLVSDRFHESIDGMNMELKRRENLVRNLAHDIRTPVTVIRGYSESLKVRYPEDERVVRYADIMVEECDRMTKMSEDMLEFFEVRDQKDYYKMERLDAEDLFGEFSHRLDNIHPGQMIMVDYDPGRFVGNRELIERAVYNLMENAIKYGVKNSVILLSGKREDAYYRFSVSNEGEAINQEDRQYIWDVFYKADKARKRGQGGYGIGLAIVREIATLHGGDVEAISRGGWTTLSFRIFCKGAGL